MIEMTETPINTLDELRTLHASATAGIWSWEENPPTLYAGREGDFGEIAGFPVQRHGLNLLGRLDPDRNTPANLDWIAASKNSFSALAARIEKLEAEILNLGEKAQAVVDAIPLRVVEITNLSPPSTYVTVDYGSIGREKAQALMIALNDARTAMDEKW